MVGEITENDRGEVRRTYDNVPDVIIKYRNFYHRYYTRNRIGNSLNQHIFPGQSVLRWEGSRKMRVIWNNGGRGYSGTL